MNFDKDRPEDYVGCLFTRTGGISNGHVYIMACIDASEERKYVLVCLRNGYYWSNDPNPFGKYLIHHWKLLPEDAFYTILAKKPKPPTNVLPSKINPINEKEIV